MENSNGTENPQQKSVTHDLNSEYHARSVTSKVIILSIIFSLIFGAIGGAAGDFYFFKTPSGERLLSQVSGGTINQSVNLTEDSSIIDVVKKASPAVVSIVISKDLNQIPGYSADPFSQDPFFNFFTGRGSNTQPNSTTPNVQEVGAGSGFFISPDGLILTNKHVVSDNTASYTVLTEDGKKYDAKVMAQDPVGDLAIVKIDISNAPYLSLADSTNLQIGQRVIAIGNSLGQYQNTVTSGIISGIGRSVTAGDDTGESEQLSGVIQTDAAINPGNSGGPLLNVSGEVVGINTAIDQQGQLVGFAIPSNDANKDIASYNKSGKITRPYLGVRYIIITPAIATGQKLPKDYGALIVAGSTPSDVAVVPGSPADKAGLVENDIIEEVAGQKVDQDHPLSDLLKTYNVGDTVSMKVYDKGNEKIVSVTLGETK